MSNDPSSIEPPDPDLLDLFAAERARPAPPPSSAVWGRIQGSIGSPSGGSSGGSSGTGNQGPDPVAPPSLPPSTGGLLRAPWWTAGVFAVGLGSGAMMHAALRPRPAVQTRVEVREVVREVVVDRAPTPVVTDAAVLAVVVTSDAAVDVAATEVATVSNGSHGESTPSRAERLTQENALITRAQNALGRGRSASALQALEEHRSRFPNGQLNEERDALWVQVLAQQGNLSAARTRAAAFRARHPRSLLLPVIDAAIRGGGSP